MKILINRKWKKDAYTIGKMCIDSMEIADTIEDKDRSLSNTMTTEYIKKKKVYGETAIPSGTYEIKLTYSPKFAGKVWGKKYKGKVPEILNVKGFQGVRIHPLNTAKDSLGCIGIGKNNVVGMVTSSTTYYYKLMDKYLIPATNKGEKIVLVIE